MDPVTTQAWPALVLWHGPPAIHGDQQAASPSRRLSDHRHLPRQHHSSTAADLHTFLRARTQLAGSAVLNQVHLGCTGNCSWPQGRSAPYVLRRHVSCGLLVRTEHVLCHTIMRLISINADSPFRPYTLVASQSDVAHCRRLTASGVRGAGVRPHLPRVWPVRETGGGLLRGAVARLPARLRAAGPPRALPRLRLADDATLFPALPPCCCPAEAECPPTAPGKYAIRRNCGSMINATRRRGGMTQRSASGAWGTLLAGVGTDSRLCIWSHPLGLGSRSPSTGHPRG